MYKTSQFHVSKVKVNSHGSNISIGPSFDIGSVQILERLGHSSETKTFLSFDNFAYVLALELKKKRDKAGLVPIGDSQIIRSLLNRSDIPPDLLLHIYESVEVSVEACMSTLYFAGLRSKLSLKIMDCNVTIDGATDPEVESNGRDFVSIKNAVGRLRIVSTCSSQIVIDDSCQLSHLDICLKGGVVECNADTTNLKVDQFSPATFKMKGDAPNSIFKYSTSF